MCVVETRSAHKIIAIAMNDTQNRQYYEQQQYFKSVCVFITECFKKDCQQQCVYWTFSNFIL